MNWSLLYDQTSAAKYWPNFSFKILPELQLQKLDQALRPKSEHEFNFMAKIQLPNLHQTVIDKFLRISNSNSSNINNSNNFNKFLVDIFTCQGHIIQVY